MLDLQSLDGDVVYTVSTFLVIKGVYTAHPAPINMGEESIAGGDGMATSNRYLGKNANELFNIGYAKQGLL